MIPRYTHPEMGGIWSEQRRYDTWLEVELAATDALAETGVVPREDAQTLRAKATFEIARIEEIEQVTQHDVIAFTTAVAEKVGPAARWLHFGLTSSDVLDTALALQMRAACDADPRLTSSNSIFSSRSCSSNLIWNQLTAAIKKPKPKNRHTTCPEIAWL